MKYLADDDQTGIIQWFKPESDKAYVRLLDWDKGVLCAVHKVKTRYGSWRNLPCQLEFDRPQCMACERDMKTRMTANLFISYGYFKDFEPVRTYFWQMPERSSYRKLRDIIKDTHGRNGGPINPDEAVLSVARKGQGWKTTYFFVVENTGLPPTTVTAPSVREHLEAMTTDDYYLRFMFAKGEHRPHDDDGEDLEA